MDIAIKAALTGHLHYQHYTKDAIQTIIRLTNMGVPLMIAGALNTVVPKDLLEKFVQIVKLKTNNYSISIKDVFLD